MFQAIFRSIEQQTVDSSIFAVLCVPRTSSISCELDSDDWRRVREAYGTVALSFLYRTFCRVLQLIRFVGRRAGDLAIEVVILRH